MHGGAKIYHGSAAAARRYVEVGVGRAEDYYLVEGAGVAERYVATPDGVRRVEPLSGEAYEAWVAGVDPDTGVAKGRLRHDARAVRFVEVIVNGPKSWSLAAALHPDVSRAYDAAQDSAARQIVGWLAQHATARVGPRGGQVQVPVQRIEAAVVRHHTSRAGDPHRHLHLQVNARVLAEGSWYGLHTIGVRDSIEAINGIGHAAMMTDPGFRAALARHGFTLDPSTGEIRQLANYVGPFSARAAQIGRNIERYERAWRATNPGREPGPALLRSWDARAWADARPDKVAPRDGAELTSRWVGELRELDYRHPAGPAPIGATSVGGIDRDGAVVEVLARLGSRRSAWNAADIRGQVEQLIARHGMVTGPAVRGELAEDLTARTLTRCVPLLERTGLPEHLRVLTSRRVLDVEADLVARLAARGMHAGDERVLDPLPELDESQRAAVRVLAGDARLVVIEGAAGAGKTTTLAATRAALERDGHRLVVVSPTRKAAQVAAREIGAAAFSAAWLAHQHRYRWDDGGVWTRLAPDEPDPTTGTLFTLPSPAAQLRASDVLLVDEAGMLDQDTARALLTIADEAGARVALLGDRHQLPAAGRGGVLDLAARYVHPDAHAMLDEVHRFIRTSTTPDGTSVIEVDEEYAELSLAMRTGTNPGSVFDALHARGQIQVHGNESDRLAALADTAATAAAAAALAAGGSGALVVVDTREQVAALNAAVRDRLVAAGCVEDDHVAITDAGQRVGVGDRVATRRNDATLGVANRDTWLVTHVRPDGSLCVTHHRPAGVTPRNPVGDETHHLPADYVRMHVELAHATTVYGAQGETTTAAHVLIGEHTTAAGAYVAMTRGREINIAHLVASDVDAAREQWVAVFARDRADLGPAHAADQAAAEATRYAPHRPVEVALRELRDAWHTEADLAEQLGKLEPISAAIADVLAICAERDANLPGLRAEYQDARQAAGSATAAAERVEAEIATHTADLAATLARDWDQQWPAATAAAQTLAAGPGRFGLHLPAVRRASEGLFAWSARWQPHLPAMPTRLHDIAHYARWPRNPQGLHDAFHDSARQAAEHTRPDYPAIRADQAAAGQRRDQAERRYQDTRLRYDLQLYKHGGLGHLPDPAGYRDQVEHTLAELRDALAATRDTITALKSEPAIRALPAERIAHEHDTWALERDTAARLADYALRYPARQPAEPPTST